MAPVVGLRAREGLP